jgi:hypothetical protein
VIEAESYTCLAVAGNPKATLTRSEGDGAPCPDCENSPAGVCPYHVEAAGLLLWYAEAALKLRAASAAPGRAGEDYCP